MKIALLSNVTVEVLAGLLRKEHRVWTPSGFGAWMETALEPPPELVAFAPELVCLLIDRRFGAFDAAVQDVGAAVERLKARFLKAAVIAPDVSRLAADLGEAFYDAKMWALGQMPFSLKGLRELAKMFSRKKVLAVDLDNTLWKGVIGEDGVAGIVPYAPFQERLLELKRRGILLVALSKNNPADVEPVWSDARMALKASDWVVQAIGWNAKPDSLAKVAAELNLGPDSFVFVDDNPVERAEMRAARPDVTVADFPPQLDVFFPFGATTAEDADKTEMYHAEACRRDFAACADSVEEYLKGLEIRTETYPAVPADVPRLAQLSQKSNQFNVCTNRYAEDEMAALLADPSRLVLSVRSRDRFGDLGLVSFVHVRFEGAAAGIVDWVMSCRAMNRRIELTVFETLKDELAGRGVSTLEARWVRTAKNAPVADLFDRLGFARTRETDSARDYRLDVLQG